jgi:hypothetical protein
MFTVGGHRRPCPCASDGVDPARARRAASTLSVCAGRRRPAHPLTVGTVGTRVRRGSPNDGPDGDTENGSDDDGRRGSRVALRTARPRGGAAVRVRPVRVLVRAHGRVRGPAGGWWCRVDRCADPLAVPDAWLCDPAAQPDGRSCGATDE